MKNFQPKDLLFIDKMITPALMTLLYWLLCVAVIIMGILSLFQNPIMGIVVIVFGLLYVRVMCEVMLVLFRINDNTKKIADASDKNAGQ